MLAAPASRAPQQYTLYCWPSCLGLFEVSHNLREILGCTVTGLLLPMYETVCASMDDPIEVRGLVWRGGDHSLRFGGGVRGIKAEEVREQCKTNGMCLWRAHLVLHRKRTDAPEGVHRENLPGLRVTLEMRIAVVRHDALQIPLHRGDRLADSFRRCFRRRLLSE